MPRQVAEVEKYVARCGHRIVATYQDIGYSGATADRPALAEMLSAEGFEAVIVPAWDRLARDAVLDGFLRYSLESRGVSVLSATEYNGVDEISKLTRVILSGVAGYERSLISQRLSGARKNKAATGQYAHGQPPFGSQASRGSKKLTIHPEEFRILTLIRTLRENGLTIREIARQLNKEGCLTRNSREWGPSSIHGALASAKRIDSLVAHEQDKT